MSGPQVSWKGDSPATENRAVSRRRASHCGGCVWGGGTRRERGELGATGCGAGRRPGRRVRGTHHEGRKVVDPGPADELGRDDFLGLGPGGEREAHGVGSGGHGAVGARDDAADAVAGRGAGAVVVDLAHLARLRRGGQGGRGGGVRPLCWAARALLRVRAGSASGAAAAGGARRRGRVASWAAVRAGRGPPERARAKGCHFPQQPCAARGEGCWPRGAPACGSRFSRRRCAPQGARPLAQTPLASPPGESAQGPPAVGSGRDDRESPAETTACDMALQDPAGPVRRRDRGWVRTLASLPSSNRTMRPTALSDLTICVGRGLIRQRSGSAWGRDSLLPPPRTEHGLKQPAGSLELAEDAVHQHRICLGKTRAEGH